MPEKERQRADLAFHELPVGVDLGSVEYELSERVVERHLKATHQTPIPESGGDRYAPVSILASDGIRLAEERFDIGEAGAPRARPGGGEPPPGWAEGGGGGRGGGGG